jgi:AraC-like DNA-binding protein
MGPLRNISVSHFPDRPFVARTELAYSGPVKTIRIEGGISAMRRDARHMADGDDDFSLGFNSGRTDFMLVQRGREAVVAPGMAVLNQHAEAFGYLAGAPGSILGLVVPRRELQARVANLDDLVNTPLPADTAPMRHLRAYLAFLLGPDGHGHDPSIDAAIESNLLDLVGLALGATRDAAAQARAGGLRAARLQAVLARIKAGFADHDCTPAQVAREVGVSERYLQELLQETGATFTERVAELRLQRARTMLESERCADLNVIEIAGCSGFSDVSHFNRRFRARFGASPTQFRVSRRSAGHAAFMPAAPSST